MFVKGVLTPFPLRAVVAVAFVAIIGAGLLRSSSGQGLSFDYEHSDMAPAEAREFTGFSLYNVGQSHEGVSLHKITRRLDTPQAPDYYRTNFVNFIYGSCEPVMDTGCMPPFQIQVWPGCIRNLSSYTMGGLPYPHERVAVRGVPAAVFDDPRVEVYTGRETVVIFAGTKEFGLQIAEALERVNGDEALTSDQPLPAPAEGALVGKLTCTATEYGPITPLPDESSKSDG